jgi:flagellar biosynthesis/type III secretory pathway ATPase
MYDKINAYLRQDIEETIMFDDSVSQMEALFENSDKGIDE